MNLVSSELLKQVTNNAAMDLCCPLVSSKHKSSFLSQYFSYSAVHFISRYTSLENHNYLISCFLKYVSLCLKQDHKLHSKAKQDYFSYSVLSINLI